MRNGTFGIPGDVLIWQPLPISQCGHHFPTGFCSSVMPRTLQHIVQPPQERPGAGSVETSKVIAHYPPIASLGLVRQYGDKWTVQHS
jgi:hypothetical protein